MVLEVLNRFIQTEIDYGEMYLLSRHMSKFCQPFFCVVNPVGSMTFILRILIILFCEIQNGPDSLVQIVVSFRKHWGFC